MLRREPPALSSSPSPSSCCSTSSPPRIISSASSLSPPPTAVLVSLSPFSRASASACPFASSAICASFATLFALAPLASSSASLSSSLSPLASSPLASLPASLTEAQMLDIVSSGVKSPNSRQAMRVTSFIKPPLFVKSSAATRGTAARASCRCFCTLARLFAGASAGASAGRPDTTGRTSLICALSASRSSWSSASSSTSARASNRLQRALRCRTVMPPSDTSGSARRRLQRSTHCLRRPRSSSLRGAMHRSAALAPAPFFLFFEGGFPEPSAGAVLASSGPFSTMWSHHWCSLDSSRLPSPRQPLNAYVRTAWPAVPALGSSSPWSASAPAQLEPARIFSAISGEGLLTSPTSEDHSFNRQCFRPSALALAPLRPAGTSMSSPGDCAASFLADMKALSEKAASSGALSSGSKYPAVSSRHMLATITSSEALLCSARASSCVGHRRMSGAPASCTPAPTLVASSAAQRWRTPGGASGASSACCHCRWKLPGIEP
mmetsp:Transcript_118749/g.322182  ORF Transcript_118749/g.322182 Transcript_118749/m.322182 type:complete len:495 (+) Transcript_118749:1323-2807(+)